MTLLPQQPVTSVDLAPPWAEARIRAAVAARAATFQIQCVALMIVPRAQTGGTARIDAQAKKLAKTSRPHIFYRQQRAHTAP